MKKRTKEDYIEFDKHTVMEFYETAQQFITVIEKLLEDK